jgi:phosphoribosyl 1,2-cyclic phosphate phosphodiesterase
MTFIRFLGTGAGDFYKGADKAGAIAGKDIRHAPSLLVAPDVLIDFYDDGQLRGFGIPEASLRHLLITHGHFDHFMPVAIHELASTLPHRLHVYGSAMVRDALDFAAQYRWSASEKRFAACHASSNVEIHCIKPGRSFRLGGLRVTPVLASHLIDKANETLQQQAFNLVLERNGRALFYGLDSSYLLPGTLEMLAGFRFDIAVFDATYGPREVDPALSGHMNWAMLDETIAEFREGGLLAENAVVVADHISVSSVGPHDDVVDELREKGITLAYDGMTLAF